MAPRPMIPTAVIRCQVCQHGMYRHPNGYTPLGRIYRVFAGFYWEALLSFLSFIIGGGWVLNSWEYTLLTFAAMNLKCDSKMSEFWTILSHSPLSWMKRQDFFAPPELRSHDFSLMSKLSRHHTLRTHWVLIHHTLWYSSNETNSETLI